MNFNRAVNILKKNNMTLVESANDNVVVTCRKRIQDHINREALPRGTTGSLSPTFVPARLVCLAVKHPYAFALDA